eukprot:10515104-Ditylum_brightwellii.AAC.1
MPAVRRLTCSIFEAYAELLEITLLDIMADGVQAVASQIHNTGGTGGMDTVNLKNWCLHYGQSPICPTYLPPQT